MSTCNSLSQVYILSDIESDAGRQNVADALNFSAGTAEMYFRKLKKLAWACKESNARKRNNVLQIVLAELTEEGESLAGFPMREIAQ